MQFRCAGKIPNALADVDRKCLAAERPEHVTKTMPESQRQKTAAVLFQDVALFHTRWAFNVSEIHPDIRKATHIWQVLPSLTSLTKVAASESFGRKLTLGTGQD